MLRAFVDRPGMQASIVRRVELLSSINKYSHDFEPYETAEGVTVSAVAWTSSNTGVVSISGEALASKIASAFLTSAGVGESVIKLVATTSGTQKAVRQWIVRVVDPASETSSDYGLWI